METMICLERNLSYKFMTIVPVRILLKKFYFVTMKFTETIISILSVVFLSSFSVDKKVKSCKQKVKQSSECIIIGNGPSANILFEGNRNFIENKDVFVVNLFCLSKYFLEIKPLYYVVADPDFFREHDNDELKIQTNELGLILNSITWPMFLFVPARSISSEFCKSFFNPYLKVVPFNTTPIRGFKFVEYFFFKSNLGMPVPESVIIASIFLAINSDYNVINLFGVEHSWIKNLRVSRDNEVYVGLDHFYEGSDRTDEKRKVSHFLLSQYRLFNSHLQLQEYSINIGKRIINHTKDSFIDAYEKA